MKFYSCYVCKRKLPRSKFRANPGRDTGIQSCCYECELAENRRRYRERHPVPWGGRKRWLEIDAERRGRAQHLWKRFKITLEDYDAMVKQQKGRCAICRGKPNGSGARDGNFHIDHDANNGKIRGLLCGNCNQGLGKFNDSPQLLRKAAVYLERAK